MKQDAIEAVCALPIWSGPIDPKPLTGSVTNADFLVTDGANRRVVRIGADLPVHQVMRFNELAASKAAHAAGVSPAVLYHAPGVLVIDCIEGRTLTPEDIRDPTMLDGVVRLVAQAHRVMPRHLRGPTLAFWAFHVIRDYAARLVAEASPHAGRMPDLLSAAERLEAAVGPVEMVFGHNDLLASKLIDDGARLWLVEWDYAGWGSPLFDLGTLAANCAMTEQAETRMLELYHDRPCDDALRHCYTAMKCAAILRETLWSMVSETHAATGFDFAALSATTLQGFEAAFSDFLRS